jgi:glycosyltransferase involved in cell wall biosynthesis
MISVGVVIPVHNRQDELSAALASVVAQTRAADEIVIVDDASNPAIELPRFACGKDAIRLIRLEDNRGAAGARQAGIDACTTSHIAFLDSDDTWLPEKIAAQVAYMEHLPADERTAVSCGWRYVYANGAQSKKFMPVGSDRAEEFASGCWFCPGSTVIMAKSEIERIGGYDVRLRRLEDLDLFIRFAVGGGRLVVAPTTSVLIRKAANARGVDIDTAVAFLVKKFLDESSPEPRLPEDTRRRLAAWLDVERAASARNSGQWARMVSYLASSFMRKPRTRVQLSRWWTYPR